MRQDKVITNDRRTIDEILMLTALINFHRYCDNACQRAHWRDHKAICKTATSSASTLTTNVMADTSSSAATPPSTKTAPSDTFPGLLGFGSGYSLAAVSLEIAKICTLFKRSLLQLD